MKEKKFEPGDQVIVTSIFDGHPRYLGIYIESDIKNTDRSLICLTYRFEDKFAFKNAGGSNYRLRIFNNDMLVKNEGINKITIKELNYVR